MKDLQFYLDRGCVVVPCQPSTKKLVRGSGEWTAEDSRENQGRLAGNAALRNGSGGLLVVDIDAKHGGSLDLMDEQFPGSGSTRAVQTVSPGEHGFGLQLIYSIPDGFKIKPTVLAHDGEGRPMIEVAAFAMLPGSRARGADGVMRVYETLRDIPPAPAPAELMAVVEARRVAKDAEPAPVASDLRDAKSRLDTLLEGLAQAGDGQRNDAFTRAALPVMRLCTILGEDPEILLTQAYERSGGTDEYWIAAAIRSAQRQASEEPAGRRGLGRLAQQRLEQMHRWARFAPWPGKSGPSDRRVFLALIESCLEYGRPDTALGSRKLALRAGLTKETVEASFKRLEGAGRLRITKAGVFTVRHPMLSPEDTTHILPPLVREITPRGNVCGGIDPLHMVWCVPSTDKGAGLDGRHGLLFDLVRAGLTTARELGDYIDSRPDSLNRTLKRLVEVGLLVRSGRTHAPAGDAAELADRLSLELGGVQICAHRENQYRDEELQWKEKQKQWEDLQESWKKMASLWTDPHRSLADFDPFAVDHDPFAVDPAVERPVAATSAEASDLRGEDYGDWLMEQLMLREVGLPNELP